MPSTLIVLKSREWLLQLQICLELEDDSSGIPIVNIVTSTVTSTVTIENVVGRSSIKMCLPLYMHSLIG